MKKIAVIGGGVAGLSAGIYARLAGFDTTIYEKNSVLGGSCSGWYRNGFAIDNCLHWLTGTNKESGQYKQWVELGVFNDKTVFLQRPWFTSSETDGVRVTLWRDPVRARREMLDISPEDEVEINLFFDCVKVATEIVANLSSIEKIAKKVTSAETVLSHMEFARRSVMIMGLNNTEWAAKFKSKAIQNLILDFCAKEYEAYWLIITYSFFVSGNADIIEGGSIQIADSLVEKYISLGGKIEINMPAKQIVIKKRKVPKIEKGSGIKTKYAEAIVFENGETVSADYIICACDIEYVFSKLIKKKKHKSKVMRNIFKDRKDFPMYSAFQMAFSVDGLFEEVEDTLGFECNPIEVAMCRYDRIMIKNYRLYGDYIAPKGKTVIQCMMIQYDKDFKYWKKLYKSDIGRYNQAKLNIAEAVKSAIIKKFPQYEGKIHILDTWTPYTYARRNNDTNGAFMRFITTAISRKATIAPEVKGVDNIYLASHWLKYPGGLPMAAYTGQVAVKKITDKEIQSSGILTKVFETLGDTIEESQIGKIFATFGNMMEDNQIKKLFESLGDTLEESQIKKIIDTLGDTIEESQIVKILQKKKEDKGTNDDEEL